MELVVYIRDSETLATVLDQGVAGVAANLPRKPNSPVWSELTDWREAARRRGLKFYLTWDWLVREGELSEMAEMLAAVARLNPDGLQLRDLGLVREARRRHPRLPLHAAGNWGAHNTPGVRLAESLGFTRVVMEGPPNLKELALVRRQTLMPLAVNLTPSCQGYASLCLLEEYLGMNCGACCLHWPENLHPTALMATLETFSGLCQLGVTAVQIRGELFHPASMAQVIRLYQSVAEASPMDRPRILAAARQVLEALGEQPAMSAGNPPAPMVPPSRRGTASPFRLEFPGRGRLWLEARDYPEAMALSREWREPLLLLLTPDNYAAFLTDHRRWTPRRLIWRLPPTIPESALAFFQKALETLGQGGYSRFVAGDWGAVALVAAAGGRVYGDQTLGVRNSWSLETARECKVARVCLPPGWRPEHWQDLLKAAPSGSFWSYLYHAAPLAACPGATAPCPPPAELRWIPQDDQTLLCLKTPRNLRGLGAWFKQQAIFPLVVALPHSSWSRGKLPPWLRSRPPGRPQPRK
jgi:collagenase-like PrtC family protease